MPVATKAEPVLQSSSRWLAMSDPGAPSHDAIPSERTPGGAPPRRRPRAWLPGAILLILALLALLRYGTFQGCVRPVRVVGGSMAAALPGTHYHCVCRDCGCPFRCGMRYVPQSEQFTCPNCGFPDNRLQDSERRAGSRVLIDRWAHYRHGPQRWQPVALRWEHASEQIAVKRVVATGGGRVSIRRGDVFVDGKIQRKTLSQLRRVRLLVHDDRYRPRLQPDLPARWQGRGASSNWRISPRGYAVPRNDEVACPQHIDWLEYQQWLCWAAPARSPRTGPVPIVDIYAYNQSVSRGQLHALDDLMLQCQLRVSGRGCIVLRIQAAASQFDLSLAYPETDCTLRHNGAIVWQGSRPPEPMPWKLEFAVCDQQVLAALNTTPLFAWPFEPGDSPARPDQPPLAIGARGVQLELDPPAIYRDIHYRGPREESVWTAPQPLGADECFVLGDNVPVSVDSRHWGPIDRRQIIGPVYGWDR